MHGRRGRRAVWVRQISLGALALWAAAVHAQPASDPGAVLARIEAAYANLEYAEAEALAWEALNEYEGFAPDQLVRIHTTLALILYARGDEREAGDQFRGALSLAPDLTLDPLFVSPTALAFFENVKAARVEESEAESVIRYVQVADIRPGATWRSAVLPGWGQRYKGETAKGWLITGAWAATLAAGTAAHFRRLQAHEAYLAQRGEVDEDEFYQTYRQWHKVRGWLFVGTAAVWAYAAGDALLTGGPSISSGPLDVAPAVNGLRIRYRF